MDSSIFMPEVYLYKTIKMILRLVREDYNSTTDKTKTILYHYFKKGVLDDSLNLETFDYYTQAINLFTQKKEVEVYMGYNMEVAAMGCVHILLPSESMKPLTIGSDQNYKDPIVSLNEAEEEVVQNVYTQVFDTTYQLMCTSENTFEVLLIYNILKGGMLSLIDHMELLGFRDPKFGGQDINIQSDLVPPHIFHRAFTVSFFYENSVPEIFKKKLIKNFTASGFPSEG